MKLHLPKQLFTALLAVITLATPATLTLGSSAWGEDTYWSANDDGEKLLEDDNTSIAKDDKVIIGTLNTETEEVSYQNLKINGMNTHGGSHSNGHFFTVLGELDASGGDLGLESGAKMTIAGGSVTAKTMTLGHKSDTARTYHGHIEMSSGSLTTGTIKLNQNHANTILITGGTLEFTSETAINRGSNTNTTITIGGTSDGATVILKAKSAAWTLDGSGLTTAPTIGNVTIDSANTHGITLKNVSLNGAVTNNATLNLVGLTVASDNLAVTNTGLINLAGLSKGTNNGDHDFDTNTKQYTSLINAISGGKVILSGSATAAANLTLQLGHKSTPGPSEVNFNADYTSYGDLTLANWSATTTWTVKDSLTVTENLAITNKQKLSIGAGASVTAGSMRLGHYDADADGATLAMTGGMLTTGTILMRGSSSNSSVSITGGSVEFTAGNAISVGQGTPEVSIKGAADAPVILKASQADWTLDGTGLSTSSVIGNVTIAEGNTHGITLKNVTLSGSIVNNAELALGSGVTVAANDEATVTGHKVQILNTLASADTLKLNADAIYVSETLQGYEMTGGTTAYSLNGTTIDENGVNGFKLHSGATYYLSKDGNVTTDCIKVWRNDTTSYDLVSNESGLHFTVAEAVRSDDDYYINSGDVTVDSNVQKLAPSYVLQGGNMQLKEGQVSTSAMSYTSGTISLSDGAVLNVDSLTSMGVTANQLLSSLVSAMPATEGATPTGKILISQSGLNTGDSGLTTAFTGKVELAENVTFTFGSTGKAKDGEVINTSSLAGVILNNGSVLKFQGTGNNDDTNGSSLSQFRNVEVNGTAEINLIDTRNSNDLDAVYLSETTNLKDGSNLKLTASYDGRIIIDNLKGSGALTSNGTTYTNTNDDRPIFYTTIKELDGFTGTLNFTDTAQHTVSVSTGIASGGVTFAGLNMAGGTDVNNTFNVQTDTTVGTVTLSGNNNSINLSERKSLSVGDGTVTNGSFSTGSAKVASKSADTPASLSHVKMTGSGFSAAASANGSKGSISNAQLTQLQADVTFTIEDMTLTNTTISAATPTTQVSLQNVTVSNVVLEQGKFSTDAPMSVEGVEGAGGTAFSASTSAITKGSSITINASAGASLAVDLGDLSCVEPMGPGKYNLSITLNGVGFDSYENLAAGSGIIFAADSWLGKLLTAQGATAYVSGAVETPASVSEGGSTDGVSVSYSAVTVDNVGSLVITIAGLNVPEPATSTLSLLALAALAARRRRK